MRLSTSGRAPQRQPTPAYQCRRVLLAERRGEPDTGESFGPGIEPGGKDWVASGAGELGAPGGSHHTVQGVCVALYCTLAALRAANQGRRGQGGGTLLLDNPIGRASHGILVRLQRDVAAARHVQLIYTTGVKDPDAVSQFPNVIRLDNRPGRSQNRRYIVEDATGNPSGEVTGVRVAHSDTPTSGDVETP